MLTGPGGFSIARLRQALARRTPRLALALLAIAAILVAARAAAPLLISSSLVRQGMERQVAQWIGHDVTISGPADVRFWPRPRIILNGISIRDAMRRSEEPIATIARVSASFDLLAALTGRTELADFHLTAPRLHVTRAANGSILAAGTGGRIGQAAGAAIADGDSQTLDPQADARLGTVRISDGVLQIRDAAGSVGPTLDKIEGVIRWPRLSGDIAVQAAARLNGRAVRLELRSPQALLLLSGRRGRLSAKLDSDLASTRFDGSIDPAQPARLEGNGRIEIADMTALAAVTGLDFSALSGLNSLFLSSRLATQNEVLRFDTLEIGINGHGGSGILDLVLGSGRVPRLTGTLAFDDMDVMETLAALASRAGMPDGGKGGGKGRAGLELDLRLSAGRAVIGPFELMDSAISIFDVGGQARFDIADSRFAGGRLTGSIARRKGMADTIALNLSVEEADLADIVRRLAPGGPLPETRGSLDLALDITEPLAPQGLRGATGWLRLRTGPGRLAGFDLAALSRLAAERSSFPLGAAAGNGFDFDRIVVAAEMRDGKTRITRATLSGTQGIIGISGIAADAEGNIMLSANLEPGSEGNTPARKFMISGSWPDPVVWPVRLPPERR